MLQRGWYYYDFLVITGDAYVDHPSFGTAIISRVLEAEGYRVAILAQPNWREPVSYTHLNALSVFLLYHPTPVCQGNWPGTFSPTQKECRGKVQQFPLIDNLQHSML